MSKKRDNKEKETSLTFKDIMDHDEDGNLWVAIHGKVYNLSKF